MRFSLGTLRLLLNLHEIHENATLYFTVNHQYEMFLLYIVYNVYCSKKKVFQLLPKLSEQ